MEQAKQAADTAAQVVGAATKKSWEAGIVSYLVIVLFLGAMWMLYSKDMRLTESMKTDQMLIDRTLDLMQKLAASDAARLEQMQKMVSNDTERLKIEAEGAKMSQRFVAAIEEQNKQTVALQQKLQVQEENRMQMVELFKNEILELRKSIGQMTNQPN
jgi:hypothetical protein